MLFSFNHPTFSYNDLRWNRFSTGWAKEKETRTKHRMEGREKSGGTILWCIIGIRYILVVVMKEILMDTRRWRRWWGFYLPSRNVDVHECTCDRRCRGQNRWNPPWITNTVWKINFIFHIVFVIRGGFHLFRPLQRLLHVHSWTSMFLLGKRSSLILILLILTLTIVKNYRGVALSFKDVFVVRYMI